MRYALPLIPGSGVPDIDIAVQMQPLAGAPLQPISVTKPKRALETVAANGVNYFRKALPMAVALAVGLSIAQPSPVEAGPIIVPPCIDTFYVHDTFGRSGSPDASDGELGATWTINDFSGGNSFDDPPFVMDGGYVRRTTLAEAPTNGNGNALMYPSGTLPPGTERFYIRFPLKFVFNTDLLDNDAFVAIYEQGAGVVPGDRFLFYISTPTFGAPLKSISVFDGTTQTDVAFTADDGQEYVARLDVEATVDGALLTLSIDDVEVVTWTRPTLPAEPFGLVIGDVPQQGIARVSQFDVAIPCDPSTLPPPNVGGATELPIEDTFATGASVAESGRTTDTGHVWNVVSAADTLFCDGDVDLLIAGGFAAPASGQCGELLSSALITSGTYTLIIDFDVIGVNGISQLGVYAQLDAGAGSFLTFQYVQGFDGSSVAANNFELTASAESGGASNYVGTGEASDGAHTLRVEVSPGSAVVKLDGVTKITAAHPAEAGTALRLFVDAGSGDSAIKLSRFRVE